MKLYVWEGVLCDYTCGGVVVIAPDKETAIKTACKAIGVDVFTELSSTKPTVLKLDRKTPTVAFYNYGGG